MTTWPTALRVSLLRLRAGGWGPAGSLPALRTARTPAAAAAAAGYPQGPVFPALARPSPALRARLILCPAADLGVTESGLATSHLKHVINGRVFCNAGDIVMQQGER